MLKFPPFKDLDEIDFQGIVDSFEPPGKSKYKLPRIVFIGYFRRLSMASQRDICRHLGFESYGSVEPLIVNDEKRQPMVSANWSDINIPYTKLVVGGNDYSRMPEWEFKVSFYKKGKNNDQPLIFKHDIRVMMEEELWRLHRDYPDRMKLLRISSRKAAIVFLSMISA